MERTVSFASNSFCDNECNSGNMIMMAFNTCHTIFTFCVGVTARLQHTSTPFVQCDKSMNPLSLDGSIFDHSTKEKATLEISCIQEAAVFSANDTSR